MAVDGNRDRIYTVGRTSGGGGGQDIVYVVYSRATSRAGFRETRFSAGDRKKVALSVN